MKEKTFTLFWLNGKSEIVSGYDIADAFRRAGYGGGAIRALDFHAVGDVRNFYQWDKSLRSWVAVPKKGTQRSPFGIGS